MPGMKFFRLFKKKRVLCYAGCFAVAGVLFVFSDAILKQNSLKITGDGSHQEGEYGTLVNWLPEEAKIAIEYRARSLFLQNRMRRTKNPDMKVRAIYQFGDYIRKRDPKGSDSVFVGIVERKEYNCSRYAFLGFGELLLNKKSGHPVTIEELHACLRRLRWPEDIYKGWEHIQKCMNIRRLSPLQRCQVYSILPEKLPHYRNFERFLNDYANAAGKIRDEELKQKILALKDKCRTYPWMPGTLLSAPVTYRESYASLEKDLQNAQTDAVKVQVLISLGRLARGIDEPNSQKFLFQVLDNPAYAKLPEAYQAYASMLLYPRTRRRISIDRYHQLLKSIGNDEMLFMAWEAGYHQLLENKNSDRIQLTYLLPLLNLKKEYVEYAELFRRIEYLTMGGKYEKQSRQAADFLIRVQETNMPSLFGESLYRFRGEL